MLPNEFYRTLTPYYDELFPVDPETEAFLIGIGGGPGPRIRRVLDAGCGTGGHVRAFHEAGIHAWGADLSPEMIEIARDRDPANRTTYTVADIRDAFTHPAVPFDLIVSIGNTLAHLSDWAEARNWIEMLPAALRNQSGSAVVQFVDLSSLGHGAGRDLPVLRASTDAGPVEMQRRYTRIDDYHYRMNARLSASAGTSPGDGSDTTTTTEHKISQTLLVLKTDLVFAAFRAAGFTEIATYGAFDRTAVDPDPSSWVRVVEAHR